MSSTNIQLNSLHFKVYTATKLIQMLVTHCTPQQRLLSADNTLATYILSPMSFFFPDDLSHYIFALY